MTNNNSIRKLEKQLEAIFSTLNEFETEIDNLDTEMRRLHQDIVMKNNFDHLQLNWEECKWNKWISVQRREKKLEEAAKVSHKIDKLQNDIE